MAKGKQGEFGTKDREIAALAKALSHPARLAILRILARKGTCICGEIVEVLPLAQSTVSQHLKELKAAGIIQGEIEGVKSCYCIDWSALNKVAEALQGLFRDVARNHAKNCC